MAGSNTFPHVIEAKNLADLASIHVAELQFGANCWVDSELSAFTLTPTPTMPVDGVNVVAPAPGAAVGKPGAAWQKGGGGGGGGAFALIGTTLAALAGTVGTAADELKFVFDTDTFYRWFPADATPPNGLTVVAAPGGNWKLEGSVVYLRAIGGGADDWSKVIGFANALAYKGTVTLTPFNGPFQCKSLVSLQSGVEIVCLGPGVQIQVALGVTGNQLNAAFSAPTGASLGATTLAAQNTLNSQTVSANGNVGGALAAGAFILIGNGLRDLAFQVVSVAGGGPFTVTLDRPARMVWTAGTTLAVVASLPSDIHLAGADAVMTGVADRFIEFDAGQRCTVEAWQLISPSTPHNDLMASFDVAGVGNSFRRMRLDGGGGRTLGIALESCEASVIEDAIVKHCTNTAVLIDDCVDCEVSRANAVANGTGVALTADGNTLGCLNCSVSDSQAIGNTQDGFVIENGSSSCTLTSCEADSNTNDGFIIGTAGAPANNELNACSASFNGLNAFTVFSGSLNSRLIGCVGARSTGFNPTFNLQSSCTLVGCDVPTGIVSEVDGGVLVTGAGTIVTMTGCSITPYYGFALNVGAGARVIAGETVFGTTDQVNNPVINVAGEFDVTGAKILGGNLIGVNVTATGTFRRSGAFDADTCVTPVVVAAGGQANVALVQLNGATPVVVPWASIKKTDHVNLTLTTRAGTPGTAPLVAVTGGVGFSVTGINLDTSTYEYEIQGG